MSKTEPRADTGKPLQPYVPAVVDAPRFVIGRGRGGGWIVNDRLGLVGGIFVSEAAACHFAFEESGGRKEQIELAAEPTSLDLDLRRAA